MKRIIDLEYVAPVLPVPGGVLGVMNSLGPAELRQFLYFQQAPFSAPELVSDYKSSQPCVLTGLGVAKRDSE